MAALGGYGPCRPVTGIYSLRRWRDYSRQNRLCNGRDMNFQEPLSGLFERIARAIERLGPRMPPKPDFGAPDAFVWQAETGTFLPVKEVNRLSLALLKGIDAARDTLLENTSRF